VAGGQTLLRETRADVLAFPGFLAVVVIAALIRAFFAHPRSPAALSVCAVILALDVVLAWYVQRTGRASFAVTPDDITFTPRPGTGATPPPPQVLRRTAGSTLSFRMQDNGIIGGQQVFRLKLRDDATGEEIAATTFGRVKVRRACQSQGWPFS
jgi:hypothetical protein